MIFACLVSVNVYEGATAQAFKTGSLCQYKYHRNYWAHVHACFLQFKCAHSIVTSTNCL